MYVSVGWLTSGLSSFHRRNASSPAATTRC